MENLTPIHIGDSKHESTANQMNETTILDIILEDTTYREDSRKSKIAMVFVYAIVILFWIVWFAS